LGIDEEGGMGIAFPLLETGKIGVSREGFVSPIARRVVKGNILWKEGMT
jgi:hypothetical protein